MRTSLIIFGVIFLVIGGFLFFMPSQTAHATTTTVDEDSSDTRTSYATVLVPRVLTYALLIIGVILTTLGFALPGPHTRSEPSTVSSETKEDITETKQVLNKDGTTHKIAHEKHTKHTREE